MKVAEVKRKFKNKWVLAEVLKMNELNQAVDVKPIFVSKDRDKVYKRLMKVPRDKNKIVTTLYTGRISGAFAL